jgi:hypothetical protein
MDVLDLQDLETRLINIFKKKQIVEFIIDLTEFNNFFELIKVKILLDKYRPYSKLYLKSTTIIIKNNEILKNILVWLLSIFKPEKEVFIINELINQEDSDFPLI